MSLDAKEWETIEEVFRRADFSVARDVASDVLHAGTALAVFGAIRDAVRPLDPRLAERLVPRACEDAASRIAALSFVKEQTEQTETQKP